MRIGHSKESWSGNKIHRKISEFYRRYNHNICILFSFKADFLSTSNSMVSMRACGGTYTSLALCLLSIVIAFTTAASGSALPDANTQIEMLLTGRLPVASEGRRGLSQIAPAPSSEYSAFDCPAGNNFTSEQTGSGFVQPPADKAVVNQSLPPPSPT